MRRAIKISLKFITQSKRRKISTLIEAYRGAVNFYIRHLWTTKGKLDAKTLALLEHTRLSERYKGNALKQALETVIATKKAAKLIGKMVSRPVFKGKAVLDAKFINVEEGRGAFDLAIHLSTLCKGKRIWLPCRKTAVLNKWLGHSGAKLIQGCALGEDNLVLWVGIPDALPKTEGRVIGIDIGINKLISDSDGKHYGRDFKAIRDKIRRRKPKSKSRMRAFAERDNYINRTVNELPWGEIRVIGCEELTGMKHGKKKNRGKSFRKAMTPWTYRRVLRRVEAKAQESRACLVRNCPVNTSRRCPMCGTVSEDNRRGENFRCVRCGYTADADYVGARNVLARTLATIGSVESPMLQMAYG